MYTQQPHSNTSKETDITKGQPIALHDIRKSTPQRNFSGNCGQLGTGDFLNHHENGPRIWRESLDMIKKAIPFGRRLMHAGDSLYNYGDQFQTLYIASTGIYKVMNLTPDGREQAAALVFRGDWMGFDGISTGQYQCSALAMDTGEVWSMNYRTLLEVASQDAQILRLVLAAMSEQMARGREVTISMSTLSADARVADFLLHWALCLQERGLRYDQFNVPMSRGEIGVHLGIRIESVSRALSRLSRLGIIRFSESGRRAITIPRLDALHEFVVEDSTPSQKLLQ